MVSVSIVEIPARDLERARAFYARVFAVELEITEVDGQRMVFFPAADEQATGLALTEGEDYVPSSEGIRLYVTVDDLEAVLARAVEAGGEIAPRSRRSRAGAGMPPSATSRAPSSGSPSPRRG